MTNPTPHLTTKEMERIPAPFERERVEELMKLFGKAARAHQLYLPNNPVYKSAHDALRAGFKPIWRGRRAGPVLYRELGEVGGRGRPGGEHQEQR